MRALITGAGGQLGRELAAAAPSDIEIVALDHGSLDITDEQRVHARVADAAPDLILNAAAYTAVDRAEGEPDQAEAVNARGVGFLADAAADSGARFIQVSTDFVFDGFASTPYQPGDEPHPLSAYGTSKLAGEQAALLLAGATVVRTSRLYSRFGRNFVTAMLDRMANRDELFVVDDQLGSPTWGAALAEVLWGFATRPDLTGIWHWSDAGTCSWYEWASAIQQEALQRAVLPHELPIHPVAAAEYPTRATRPAYSVLDSSQTVAALRKRQRPWREALGSMLDQMVTSPSEPEAPGGAS